MIVAGNAVGVNTLPELIALAKSKPGELTYAANFRGSLPNMTGEMFAQPRRHQDHFHALSRRAAGAAGRAGRADRRSWWRGSRCSSARWQSNSVKALADHLAEAGWPNYPDLPAAAETLPGYRVARLVGVHRRPPEHRTTWCAR